MVKDRAFLHPLIRDFEDEMETVAVIDFETTGASPDQGSRATEIAVVLVREGRIVDR
jgi:DNA polymerase III epsilon subunit-like protein